MNAFKRKYDPYLKDRLGSCDKVIFFWDYILELVIVWEKCEKFFV